MIATIDAYFHRVPIRMRDEVGIPKFSITIIALAAKVAKVILANEPPSIGRHYYPMLFSVAAFA
ncbi:hypothetical protein M527_22215 [Sphingobium indicum IP26]|nr:hypothetical protein M527_22215 [Sphingobium indicum IP26]EQB01980.1 hypothetical protein L286_14720 [Sphingobium sp. HDIP04]